MGIFDEFRIVVIDHAVYQFALRFNTDSPTSQDGLYFLRQTIELEVKDGFENQRFSAHRPASLAPPVPGSRDDQETLYVWTPDEQRIYAVKHSEEPPQFAVITTFRAGETRH